MERAAVHLPLETCFRQMETFGQTREVLVTVERIDDGEFQ
jgi:hypothetical protein